MKRQFLAREVLGREQLRKPDLHHEATHDVQHSSSDLLETNLDINIFTIHDLK